MIRLARLDGGTVVHLVRWTSPVKWRSECSRVWFTWEGGMEVGCPVSYGGSPRPAAFDVLDRPICLDCLRRIEADRRQIDEWLEEAP